MRAFVTGEWKECPRCKAPRIRSRYEVGPGYPGFHYTPDCSFMRAHGKRRKRKNALWNYSPKGESVT